MQPQQCRLRDAVCRVLDFLCPRKGEQGLAAGEEELRAARGS